MTNIKGFAILPFLITLAVALAGAGIWVYQTQIVKPKPAPAAQKTNEVLVETVLTPHDATTTENQTMATSTPAADVSGGNTYRNEEYGFEIKYPDYFSVKDSFPESQGLIFPCGKQLGDSFRVASSEHSNPTIYDFTVYSNPQKLAAKEFFLCKINAARNGNFSESEINGFAMVSLGREAGNGTKIIWDTSIETVLLPLGNNMIEIQWQKGQSNEAISNEFDQMLSTFKLVDYAESSKQTSPIDNDHLLDKMFPNFKFNGGVAKFPERSDGSQSDEHLLLKEVKEDSFTKAGEKERLFLVMKEPAAHAEGFFHAWLGLFDRDGNLLTGPSVFPEANGSYCDSCPETYIAEKDNGFVADYGTFAYYECEGIKYILFASKYQPNGGICGSYDAIVMKFGSGRFETIQKINSEILENNPVIGVAETKYKYGINIIPADNKIMINKINIVPQSKDNFSPCEGSLYKTLNWNKETCRFE